MSSPDEIVDYLVENVALFGAGGECQQCETTARMVFFWKKKVALANRHENREKGRKFSKSR